MIVAIGEAGDGGCFLGVFSSREKALAAIEKVDGPAKPSDKRYAHWIDGQHYDWYLKECQLDVSLDCGWS